MKPLKQRQQEALGRRRVDLGKHNADVNDASLAQAKARGPSDEAKANERYLAALARRDRALTDIHNLERKLGVA